MDKRLANLNNAAIAKFNQGQFDQAQREFAALTQTARNRNLVTAEVAAIANHAVIHEAQADYVGALGLLKQLPGKPQDATSQSRLQLDLGRVYEKLGNYERAQVQYSAALKASDKASNAASLANQAAAYSSLGFLYNRQGQYHAAIANFEKALRNFDTVRLDARPVLHRREMVWNGLGEAKLGLRDYAGASKAYAEALRLSREANCQNRLAEAMALQGQGDVAQQQGQGNQALAAYGQTYAIRSKLKDVAGQAETLEGIGQWYASQGQRVLAIVFYKQAVANLEKVRQNIETLSLDEQTVYERSVQQTYRQLVDLLLQQDRVLEAQEVLELLRIQQLHEFFKDVRDRPKNGTLFFWPEEKQLFAQFEALQPGSLVSFVSIAEETSIREMQRRSRLQIINKDLLSVLQQNLKGISEDSALFYPIVLPDRVKLLLILGDGEIIPKEVKISEQALSQKVSAFRNAIGQESGENPAQKGEALYQILIAPLEEELKTQGIETLIYAADNKLRYIPLGALFDGEQWLIERFKINNITAASGLIHCMN